MRYPAEETAERHERILDAASRMFREHGFEGVSVADVMRAAGLTHGAFPAHFASKEAMAVAGVERALTEMLALADRAAEAADPRATFVARYLSTQHRDNPDHGCAMATLAPEIARKGGGVRRVFTAHINALVDRIAQSFLPRRRSQSRAHSIVTLSTLVGAITLARAVDDPSFSAEILVAARAQFGVGPEKPVVTGRSFEDSPSRMRFPPIVLPVHRAVDGGDIQCKRGGGEIRFGEGDDWLEILCCGMVHPAVLRNCGLDPDVYQGFAWVVGIDRLAMLKYGLPDLRPFFDADVRWMAHYGFRPLDFPTLAGGLSG